VARMRTLNSLQAQKGKQMHLCLAANSLVLTQEDGYKPIKKVRVGEHVLTHLGRWRTVLASQGTGTRPVVEVNAQGVPGLRLTPDHELWTRRVRKLAWSKSHSKKEASKSTPAWTRADEVTGSYINHRLPETTAENTFGDSLYWWVVGRWIADGHWSGRGTDTAVISCGYDEVRELKEAIGRYGGNSPHDCGTAFQISLRDRGGCLRTMLRKCGHGASNKCLPPEAYTLPAELSESLLRGFLSGDGSYTVARGRWTGTVVSRKLCLGILFLAQRVYGAVGSLYPGRKARKSVIQGRSISCKQEWVFCFDVPNGNRRKPSFILDDGAWKKVRSVKDAGEMETWNLRVEEDESYTAEGCIVKNCPLQFDIANRVIAQFSMPRELVLDPFAGIGTVPMCAIEQGRKAIGIELCESYWYDACAYAEAAERKLAVPSLFDLETV